VAEKIWWQIHATIHTSFDDRSFGVAGRSVWNGLSLSLRHGVSYKQFKRLLKTFLSGSDMTSAHYD